MHNVRPRLLAAAVALALTIPLLAGCSTNTTPDPAEASKSSASLKGTFTGLMPRLLATLFDGADMDYKRVREESCLPREEGDPQDQQLTDDGWEKKNEVEKPDIAVGSLRTLFYRKGDQYDDDGK